MTNLKKTLLFLLCCQIYCFANLLNAADTKYPIVLIHGLYGFSDRILCFARYFGDIPELLTNHGATVYVAKVSQIHTFSERGEQLHQQLLRLGYDKYNLIGHSLGGLDARYVLENYPHMVASVTTIGTPHRGSKIADYLERFTSNHTHLGPLSLFAGNLLGYLIGTLCGELHWQDAYQSLHSLTTLALARYNRDHPTGVINADHEGGSSRYKGIRLYSWGSYGVENHKRCDLFRKILISKTIRVFDEGEINDGIVSLDSMKFGKWLGAYEQGHHLVPVGGIVSSISDMQSDWSRDMFLKHAYRLKRKGL
ncbi:MAG TPA: alpha/beta fold hydrolase [Myxococcota bacterium]|nr:alpha/beta fold hydrolase [Myxococcota bacterium]